MNMETIFNSLFTAQNQKNQQFSDIIKDQFEPDKPDQNMIIKSLSSAFIISLCGKEHPLYDKAERILEKGAVIPAVSDLARFFLDGLSRIKTEIEKRALSDPDFKSRLSDLTSFINSNDDNDEFSGSGNTTEEIDAYWSLFFPEGKGIYKNKEERKRELKEKRTVTITSVNPAPVTDPGKQIIFTSNILLSLPAKMTDIEAFPGNLKKRIAAAMTERQLYFYDHPVQIGVVPKSNEILYGLKNLNDTCRWEKEHGNMEQNRKLTCILSVSVTHKGLQPIAKEYIHYEISKHGDFTNLDIYVFTEEDTEKLVEEILIPAAITFFQNPDSESIKYEQGISKELIKRVFGVDGEYGRHYSFLKAIAAFWQVFINPEKTATFKIDLDQVFPEKELKEQTGESAFEHFKNPLWGSLGKDSYGNEVELGMIAGALVNEKDISKGIYTPDVLFDNTQNLTLEERFFHSKLMMGFSTEAELMTRYGKYGIDGKYKCIQRIHVTGGTNGILIKSLRKNRPFTPTFIGRAEDQCYLLSVLVDSGLKLAYLHEDGLIMRHDKEAFASAAIKAASFGSIIGDYIRILYFSKYAEVLTGGNIAEIKKIIDPFTGCFVSKIPVTIVYLRFALKSLDFFLTDTPERGKEFLLQGYKRIEEGIRFTSGDKSHLEKRFLEEKKAWTLYYDILDTFQSFSTIDTTVISEFTQKARHIVEKCRV